MMDGAADFEIKASTPIPVLLFEELEPRLEANSLVKGLLGNGSMSVVYGEANCGKTFLALDVALHVALGWDWRGHRVRRAGALYIAGEGAYGIQNRVAAFRSHHDIASDHVPFAVVPSPLDLRSERAQTDSLVETMAIVGGRLECPIGLIVVDTLSRALAGGNENAPDDMGAFVKHVDSLRQATGAHVLVIHHSGKDQQRGARGHSLLRAAVDTEIEVTREDASGVSTAWVRKQRDLAADATGIAFTLERVELGQDSDGDPVSSCVVIAADAPQPRPKKAPQPNLTPSSKIALNLLRKVIAEAGQTAPASNHIPTNVRVVTFDLWRRYCYQGQITDSENSDTKSRTFRRAAEILVSQEMVGKSGDWVWLCHS